MAVLSKNTTYGQMIDMVKSGAGIYDDPMFSMEYLIKVIDEEVSRFYSQQVGRDFYQQRATFNLSGSANPYSIDLSSTLPFPYRIIDVVYKGSGRVSVSQITQARLENELQLTSINANSIYCSIGGDSIDFSFGEDISVVTSQSIEVLYVRQPTQFTGAIGKRFQVDTAGTLTTGLKMYYPLHTNANSFWGINNLTNNNGVTFGVGKVVGCAIFGGVVDQKYLWSDEPCTTSVLGVTCIMWAYIQDTLEKGCIFHNGDRDLAGGWGLGVGSGTLDVEGNELIGLSDGKAFRDYNSNIGTGWHLISQEIESVTGTTTWRGFVDNVQCTSTLTGQTPNAPQGTVVGANRALSASPRFFNGKVCELAVYDKILSTQEKADWLNGGAGQTMENSLDTKLDCLDMDIPIVQQNIIRKLKV